MNGEVAPPTYAGYRFPAGIIAHAVGRSFRFAPRSRDAGELRVERRGIVTQETIRRWSRKFGQAYANALRRRHLRPGDKWHLDELVIHINGTAYSRWRAVDHEDIVLDILVQGRPDNAAATTFRRTLLKGPQDAPRVVITHKLASDDEAWREMLRRVAHRRHHGLNDRAANAHQPARAGAAHPPVQVARARATLPRRPRRHRPTAHNHRHQRDRAFATRRGVADVAAAA